MRKTFLVALVAFWTGGGWAHAAGTPIKLHPKNPHYFEFRGKPTVLVSSAEHYGAVINLDFDFIKYLDSLAQDKLNLTRLWVGGYIEDGKSFGISQNTLAPKGERFLAPWARSSTPGAKGYGKKFDLKTWDPAYWDRLKRYLSEAGKRGIIVEVVLFCPYYTDGQWALSPWNEANNVNGIGKGVSRVEFFKKADVALAASRDGLVKKLVTELNGFDNIYYELVNEPYSDQLVPASFEKYVADVVVATQKTLPNQHLIAQNISNGSAKIKDPNPDVSIFNFHYAAPPVAVDLNYGLDRVIADDETGFRGQEDEVYRVEAWNFLLAGGAVFDHLDYSYTTDHPDGTRMPLPKTEPGGGGPAFRRQMRILRGFFDSMDFVAMAPRQDLQAGAIGAGVGARILATKGSGVSTVAAYLSSTAAKGNDYSVPAKIALPLNLPAGSWRAEWLDPTTGATKKRESFTHKGGLKTLAAPGFTTDIAVRLTKS